MIIENGLLLIMKFHFAFVLLFLTTGSLLARTWTSSDGSKEIEGDFKSFDAETNQVTIVVEDQEVEFNLEKLSEDDRSFVQKHTHADEVSITQLLSQATIHQIVGDELKEVSLDIQPDYFLLY